MKNLIFALAILLSLATLAQNNQAKIIQAAFQKVNGGNAEEAIKDLNALLKDNPENAQAWSTLGLAYRNKKDFDQSLNAYKKARELQSNNSQHVFNLGVAYAFANQKDAAFEWLLKLKETNSYNLTNIGLSPAAAILSDDSRYRELFPTQEEFAHPFKEEGVEILQEWVGENPNDQFGWIGRNIGDVDGDGVMDVTSSAPTNNDKAPAGGKVYVHSGKSGKLLWSYASAEKNGQLGLCIESAGDVNGDKTPDVVASAPYVNKVFVLDGKSGKIIYEWTGRDPDGAFGRGVKGVGDVNKDGFGDVLIGEPFQIWGSSISGNAIKEAGKVYLYSGKDGSVLRQWEGKNIGEGFGSAVAGETIKGQTFIMIGSPAAGFNNRGEVFVYKNLDAKPFFVVEPDSTCFGLGGMFMSVVGDINGDKVPDLYASDWGNAALGPSTGRIYVHSGADGKRLLTLTGEGAGDGFGIGVADTGDVNKDGFDDLVIGAWQHGVGAPSGGKVYVYSGKDGKQMRTITCDVQGETFGFDATGIRDVNGDGINDLLLTSAWSAINGVRSGRMLIISGKVK